jgi:SAM-dependent methyltransferase
MTKPTGNWRVWDKNDSYGELLYRRAVGELPEMESSKATAKQMKGIVRAGDCVLDVGCGAGHYLRSLRRVIKRSFDYTGADATANYIKLARKAWAQDQHAHFSVEDAFKLSFADQSFDLVMSCNLFLHLPSIRQPLAELVRVARRAVIIRTLVGERSFRIKEVQPAVGRKPGDEFDADGEPRHFNYYNIYSQAYVSHLLKGNPAVRKFRILPDHDFNRRALTADAKRQGAAVNSTRVLGDWQVNGCILQPWQFVVVEKKG